MADKFTWDEIRKYSSSSFYICPSCYMIKLLSDLNTPLNCTNENCEYHNTEILRKVEFGYYKKYDNSMVVYFEITVMNKEGNDYVIICRNCKTKLKHTIPISEFFGFVDIDGEKIYNFEKINKSQAIEILVPIKKIAVAKGLLTLKEGLQ